MSKNNIAISNLRSCIKTAKSNGFKQTDIIKIVGEIYNPLTSKAITFVTPFALKQTAKIATKVAASANKSANATAISNTQRTQTQTRKNGGKTTKRRKTRRR